MSKDFVFWYAIMATILTVVAIFVAIRVNQMVFPLRYVKEQDDVAIFKTKETKI